MRHLNRREIIRFLVKTRVKEKPELAGFRPELTAQYFELASKSIWTPSGVVASTA